MKSLFESLFVTKKIIREKYPNGWTGWLNDGMSDEDDRYLTRFTTMDGLHMYNEVNRLISYGLRPPVLINNVYYCLDYYLSVYEFYQYVDEDISKYECKPPKWLKILPQPKMKLVEIDKNKLNINDYNGLDYLYNSI